MKNVVLIGDSIRLGYQKYVQEALGEDVKIYAPKGNCCWTKYTLWHMFIWMEEFGWPRVDLIHWNNGIWDLHRHIEDGEVFTSLEEYVNDNRRLAIQMASYTDKLIWATTIPGGKALDLNKPYNPLINTNPYAKEILLSIPQAPWNRDVEKYNGAVADMLRGRGVRINDLYSLLKNDTDRYISGDGIHPNEEGYRLLGERVANEIKAML